MIFTSALWECNFYTIKCQIPSDQLNDFVHVYTSMESSLIQKYRIFPLHQKCFNLNMMLSCKYWEEEGGLHAPKFK